MSSILEVIFNFLHNMLQLLSFGKKKITNELNIYVKTNTGNILSLDLDPKWDIKNVKEIVGPQLGISPNDIKIIFAGKELLDTTVIEVRYHINPYNVDATFHSNFIFFKFLIHL